MFAAFSGVVGASWEDGGAPCLTIVAVPKQAPLAILDSLQSLLERRGQITTVQDDILGTLMPKVSRFCW